MALCRASDCAVVGASPTAVVSVAVMKRLQSSGRDLPPEPTATPVAVPCPGCVSRVHSATSPPCRMQWPGHIHHRRTTVALRPMVGRARRAACQSNAAGAGPTVHPLVAAGSQPGAYTSTGLLPGRRRRDTGGMANGCAGGARGSHPASATGVPRRHQRLGDAAIDPDKRPHQRRRNLGTALRPIRRLVRPETVLRWHRDPTTRNSLRPQAARAAATHRPVDPGSGAAHGPREQTAFIRSAYVGAISARPPGQRRPSWSKAAKLSNASPVPPPPVAPPPNAAAISSPLPIRQQSKAGVSGCAYRALSTSCCARDWKLIRGRTSHQHSD
jgi:hypothetical protein